MGTCIGVTEKTKVPPNGMGLATPHRLLTRSLSSSRSAAQSLSSCLRRQQQPSKGARRAVSWSRPLIEEFAVEVTRSPRKHPLGAAVTDHCVLACLRAAQTENARPVHTDPQPYFRLRQRSHTAGGAGDLFLKAWTAPGMSQQLGPYALRQSTPPAATPHRQATTASTPSAAKKARRQSASPARTSQATPQPLPAGWREEVRVPQSGRKYRVFLGPQKGQYAETASKAWEAFERIKRAEASAAGDEGAETADGSIHKRKRAGGRRGCLACDLGRKRRCTCGKRTRRW